MRGINSGNPAPGGTSGGVPFLWFVSLGKQRNEQTGIKQNHSLTSTTPKHLNHRNAANCRSCTFPSKTNAKIAPSRARPISDWVSQM